MFCLENGDLGILLSLPSCFLSGRLFGAAVALLDLALNPILRNNRRPNAEVTWGKTCENRMVVPCTGTMAVAGMGNDLRVRAHPGDELSSILGMQPGPPAWP